MFMIHILGFSFPFNLLYFVATIPLGIKTWFKIGRGGFPQKSTRARQDVILNFVVTALFVFWISIENEPQLKIIMLCLFGVNLISWILACFFGYSKRRAQIIETTQNQKLDSTDP